MRFNLDNFKNQPPIVIIKDEDINGLSFFKKRLERLLFSEVIIRNSDVEGKKAKLVIEIACNFSLQQGMVYLKSGIWGQQRKVSKKLFENSVFYKLVEQLQQKNNFPIIVEELSIILYDSTIIINKLYTRSIPEQLDAILTELSNHYIDITHDMRQVPYEIFIPVFDEDVNCDSSNGLVSNVNTEDRKASDYFEYWALYFEDQKDALIYDVKERNIINGELNMLNN